MTGEGISWIIVGFFILIVILIWLVAKGAIDGFSVSLRELSLKVLGHSKKKPPAGQDAPPERESSIYGVVHRIKRVMLAHGMRPEHWQRFFKTCNAPFSITPADLKDDDSLLTWIDSEKIQWLCELLLVRRDWMDGEAYASPHQHFHFNKCSTAFFEAIETDLKQKWNTLETESAKAIFALDRKKQDAESDPEAKILLAFGIPLCRLSDELVVYRWIYDNTLGCPWNVEPYRSHIRIIARLAHCHFHMHMYGLYLEEKDFSAIQDGDALLPEILKKPDMLNCFWHPDDYALSSRESRASKMSDSLPVLLKHMAEQNLPCADETPLFATE